VPMLRAVGKADRWLIAQYDSLRTDVEKSRLALLDRQAELSRLTQDKLRETSLLEASIRNARDSSKPSATKSRS